MKRKYMVFAGTLAVCVMAAGCGCGKKNDSGEQQSAQVTVAPAEDNGTENLVAMQTPAPQEKEDQNIKNVIGTKTETASSLILINRTGSEVSQIYIRPTSDDDDEWGEELVKGSFKLANEDKAIYYYERNTSSEGSGSSLYDIRICYTDTDRSDCYFRNLPIRSMQEITLRMDGSGEDGIPFATFKTLTSTKEYSTLNEVKKRLGLTDDSEDEENTDEEDTWDEEETDSTPTSTPAPTYAPTEAPEPTAAPQPTDSPYEEPVVVPNESANQAKEYIGQTLDDLIGSCGSPFDSDYEDSPETGETGYHYYNGYTVSTSVDENGNEIVTGVW